MTIKRKIEHISRDEVIAKGGKVSADNEQDDSWTHLCLRIPMDMVKSIDAKRKKRIGISRTAWILEVLQDKLNDQ